MSRAAEKVPGWVERLLIPTMESRIRLVVKEEVSHLEKVMEARLGAIETRVNSGFETVDAKIDSLEKRLPVVQELAEIKARLQQVEAKMNHGR